MNEVDKLRWHVATLAGHFLYCLCCFIYACIRLYVRLLWLNFVQWLTLWQLLFSSIFTHLFFSIVYSSIIIIIIMNNSLIRMKSSLIWSEGSIFILKRQLIDPNKWLENFLQIFEQLKWIPKKKRYHFYVILNKTKREWSDKDKKMSWTQNYQYPIRAGWTIYEMPQITTMLLLLLLVAWNKPIRFGHFLHDSCQYVFTFRFARIVK